MHRRFFVVTAALLVAAACLVPGVDLTGKACDSEHPCSEGSRCVEGVCLGPLADAGLDPGTDGGLAPDAGTPGCLQGSIECVEGKQIGCEDGEPVVLEDCAAAGELCDATYGCLPACGADEECPSGRACDGATRLCFERPKCARDSDCAGEARCASGACLAPSKTATVTTPDGIEPADLSCYPPAGTGSAGPAVTLRGLLVSASGIPAARTIGYSLELYRAADWVAGAEPFATVAVGSTDDGSGGAVGSFEIAAVPTDEDLVAASAGPDGMPTYQYFRVPSRLATAGVVDRFNLVSHERALWQSLVASVDATVVDGRAGIDGQVFDCRNPSRRVAGVTASLDVAARAAYTLPGLVAIDPGAAATANNGRFFFFDVPVMSVGIAVGIGPELVVHRAVRTVADSVTVFSITP